MGSNRFFFPFFWKDFLLSTTNWTDEQVGAYLRLLCWAWDLRGLPMDEIKVQRMGGWKAPAWRRIWAVVGEKFERRGDRLVNVRQEEIRVTLEARSTSARSSAEARWAADRADANAYADAIRTQSDGNANKEDQTKYPPPTPPVREGRRTKREQRAVTRGVGPIVAEAPWREACAAAGHSPLCGTPTACEVLRARQVSEETAGASA